jgi:hypothetical protein
MEKKYTIGLCKQKTTILQNAPKTLGEMIRNKRQSPQAMRDLSSCCNAIYNK